MTNPDELLQGRTFVRRFLSPFRFLRVDALTELVCAHCGERQELWAPMLVDWCDRASAEDQRRAGDGVSCAGCDALLPPEVPFLQYRRSDGIGLLVVLPVERTLDRCETWIRDVLMAAQAEAGPDEGPIPDLNGASVVVSVPNDWFGSLWNQPLGPRLLGCAPLALPISDEEAQRWRTETLTALALPDVVGGVAAFLSASSREDALAVAEQRPELMSPPWRLTVDTLLALHRNEQTEDSANAFDARAAVLRQARTFGVGGVREIIADAERRPLIDAAASATDPEERLDALRVAAAAPGPPKSPMRVAALNAYVQALHDSADRSPATDDEILRAAARAVEVATELFGPEHEVTIQAGCNRAVCIEEQVTDDPRAALNEAVALLEDLAPRAARCATSVIADVAVNLATLTAGAPDTYADNPEAAAELLALARHVHALLTFDGQRETLTSFVNQAAVLRSRQAGSLVANAAQALALLDQALALDAEWMLLTLPELAIVSMNRSNAMTTLHAHARASAEQAREAALAAVAAADAIEPHHPVAVQSLSNAGATLTDLYIRAGEHRRRAHWEEACNVLERATTAAAAAFPPHHPVALRARLHLAAAYGAVVDGAVADRDRSTKLLEELLEHTDDHRYTMAAAANLAQLRTGHGDWAGAASAYADAAAAHDALLTRARTLLGRLGVIADQPDLAARRALSLVLAQEPTKAVATLEANRARLLPRPQAGGLAPPARGSAVLHLATSDHGTAGVVSLPDGTTPAFANTLTSSTLKRLLGAVLGADDVASRRAAVDALLVPLVEFVIDPVATFLDGHDVEDLLVVACGALAACPLHAVQASVGTRWADRHTVRYRVSAGTPTPPPPNPDAVLAIVDPDGTLPLARAEREAAERWAGSLSEPPPGADPGRWLTRRLPSASVLHLACHAQLDPEDMMASAFELGLGRRLTVADLADIATPDLSLVVAPACQSAAPGPLAPDELLGVGHALAHAGARVVIASLWDADDAVTALVVSRFYAELQDGVDAALALSRAQRYVSSVTGPEIRFLARARIEDDHNAAWLPYDLAIELSALSVHPDFRSSTRPCFGHPADWATLSCLEA